MHPSQSGHARRSHHTRSSNLSPPTGSASEPPPLQPSRSETAYRHLNPFGPTQTQQKPSLAQNQSSFEVLSVPTKKVKHDQHNFTENVHGAPHGVRFSEEQQLKKQGHEMYTDNDEHDYQLKISSLKHLIGEGQHIKPQDVLQKGRHLPQDMDSVWNTRPNLQGLSQFSDEKNRIPIDAMLKEEEISGKEIENTGLIIPALKKPTSNSLGNNDILPLSNLYSHIKRQQMEQQLIQQQQQQQQHLAMLQARQQLILQQQEAKFMQQHLMKQMQPLDLYLQQQQQQLARQFQQNYNKYDQMSLINQRKMGGQEVPDMLTSHPVFQYNNMLLAQQQQAGLNPHVLSGLNQRLNFNRQAENDLEVTGKNLEAEKITKIPELKFEDTLIKREEAVSDGSSKPPPSRKKNSMSSQEDNRKSQKSSTIESTPVNQADNNKESGRARRKNKWQIIAEQQAQEKKGNEGMDFGELDPIQIARSNQAYIEGVSEEKCTDNDFLLKVMVTDDPLSLGYENPRHEFKVITEYNLENRTMHTGARYQVNVPVISLKPSRPVNTRKKPLEPLWDPSAISKSDLDGYFEDLCKSFNCKKINQERALKLLKRKNYKREKVKVNISKNEKFYSSFLAVPDVAQEMGTDGQSAQERPPEQ